MYQACKYCNNYQGAEKVCPMQEDCSPELYEGMAVEDMSPYSDD